MERTSIMNARTSLLTAVAMLAATTAALASIPNDLPERSRSGVIHVCRDREPTQSGYVQCIAHEVVDDATTPYTAAECVDAGLPARCTIDFIPKVKVTGTMLLVNDDFAEDESGGSITATAIVLDVKAKKQTARILEAFDGDEIGHWNSFDETFLVDRTTKIAFSDADKTAFNFASDDNLVPMGDAIRALAELAYPDAALAGTVPIITSVKRSQPKKNIDHDGLDPLASAARFKIVIQFARAQP
jgi:hypothetical protein